MTRILTAVLIGVFIGVVMYTFHYAEGFSYVSTEPQVCANCHIMRSQLDSWQKSSHHKAALCVDCHLPHDFIGKYIAKADNGRRHSTGFTFQNFHEPITITEKDSGILQKNRPLHEPMVQDLVMMDNPIQHIKCVNVEGVGHGEQVGFAA
jgi:cytochrome c nitrite reductase small subunit